MMENLQIVVLLCSICEDVSNDSACSFVRVSVYYSNGGKIKWWKNLSKIAIHCLFFFLCVLFIKMLQMTLLTIFGSLIIFQFRALFTQESV